MFRVQPTTLPGPWKTSGAKGPMFLLGFTALGMFCYVSSFLFTHTQVVVELLLVCFHIFGIHAKGLERCKE